MTSQQQNYIRYGSAESEPEGLRDFMDAAIEASFENEEEEEDITVVDKTCICKNNVNKRWTSDGSDIVCDDCQLGGKNDTWLRICYNCGQHPLKGFSGSGRVKCSWRWIGEDCDDCSWICDKCDTNCDDEEEEEEESDNFIKWSQSDFVDRDTCYFCGVGAGNCWVVGGEDAVCCGCEEKWRYDENKDGYIKK